MNNACVTSVHKIIWGKSGVKYKNSSRATILVSLLPTLVGVAGFEPTASWSRTKRTAINHSLQIVV